MPCVGHHQALTWLRFKGWWLFNHGRHVSGAGGPSGWWRADLMQPSIFLRERLAIRRMAEGTGNGLAVEVPWWSTECLRGFQKVVSQAQWNGVVISWECARELADTSFSSLTFWLLFYSLSLCNSLWHPHGQDRARRPAPCIFWGVSADVLQVQVRGGVQSPLGWNPSSSTCGLCDFEYVPHMSDF